MAVMKKKKKKENIGRTFFDINHRKIFIDPPPILMEIKTIINKWDLIKLKNLCIAKEIQNKEKNSHNGGKYLQVKQLARD